MLKNDEDGLQNVTNMKIDINTTSFRKERPQTTHHGKGWKQKPEQFGQMEVLGSQARILMVPTSQLKQLRAPGRGFRPRTTQPKKRHSVPGKEKDAMMTKHDMQGPYAHQSQYHFTAARSNPGGRSMPPG